MQKYKLEYIWLDGYEPVPNLRGKTKIAAFDRFPAVEELPLWGFDGSSTKQADGSDSDCVLKPVALYPDPARTNGILVMCEVLLPDGTPHPSNSRAGIPDDPDTWFGFEQEYFFYADDAPLGFPGRRGLPRSAGRVLHRRRAQERRLARARDRRRAPRPLPRGRASTTRESTPRSPRASGSSRSSARARSGPPTRCGSRATCSCASARGTASTSTGTASRSGPMSTGTVPACTRTSRTGTCARSAARSTSSPSWTPSSGTRGAHRGLRARQPPSSDGPARDAVDRHVQLGCCRPRRLDPRAAQLRERRLPRVPRGSQAQLAG